MAGENLFGMVGTGNWQTDAEEPSWREGILYYWPNGPMPLTAMMSKVPTESITAPVHHWWVQAPPPHGGAITPNEVYLESGSKYTTGGTAGQMVKIGAIGAKLADNLKAGHVIQLMDTDYVMMTCNLLVHEVVRAGASSYLWAHLIEADTNGSTDGRTLANCNYLDIVGSAHAEGAGTPDALGFQPEPYENYVQEWRNSFYLTETAEHTKTRYGGKEYQRLKKSTMYLHGIEQEKSVWFGVKRAEKAENGQLRRYAMGIFEYIRKYANEADEPYISDFRRATEFTGKKWYDVDGGKTWINEFIKQYYSYTATESMIGFCGNGALDGVNMLAEMMGDVKLETSQEAYGIRVVRWITVHGELVLKACPLFNRHPVYANSIWFVGPRNVRFRPIEGLDTRFVTGCAPNGATAKLEEYRTNGTFEFGPPKSFMALFGVGQDNVL